MLSRSIEIVKELIQFSSVSAVSNQAISNWIAVFLEQFGFDLERYSYSDQGVLKHSLIARRLGTANGKGIEKGGVVYCSHCDVVPADDWLTDLGNPFIPLERDGKIYGRGACDMKGSIATALAAIESISQKEHEYPIYFVCTADEEIGFGGAKQIAAESQFFADAVDNAAMGIIGEPTEMRVVHAHKGSVKLRISSRGMSAHSSSDTGINANLAITPVYELMAEIAAELAQSKDYRNDAFTPDGLSWNYVIRNEPFALNVTPAIAEIVVFFRTMPEVDHSGIVERIRRVCLELNLDFDYTLNSQPFWVPPDASFVRDMTRITGNSSPETVCYGTDLAALHPLKRAVVCGPGSIDQAHRNDEFIELSQLELGCSNYQKAFLHFSNTTP